VAEIERLDGLAGPRQARRIEDFDALYAAGTPAWDIGRPQPAFRELADRGRNRRRRSPVRSRTPLPTSI
jgi:hypothetical protein